MAGALEDCLVVAGGLEAVEPKRKVGFGKNIEDEMLSLG